jgi:uncharacterized protein YqgC (DUF456 family)
LLKTLSALVERTTRINIFQQVGMFAIAACVSFLADNVARIYVTKKLGAHENDRVKYA